MLQVTLQSLQLLEDKRVKLIHQVFHIQSFFFLALKFFDSKLLF